MKKYILTILSVIFIQFCNAQINSYKHPTKDFMFAKTYDPRSDTIDILNYKINLNITDFTNKIISGSTLITFRAKQNNIQYIRLDLLALSVDSVMQNGVKLNFNHQNAKLSIKLNSILNTNNESAVMVYYKGTPAGDATGWGGFYFQNGYAFNLGVGFGADPHVYGRVWFPCFDNFMERSTFDFNITTNNGKVAYCNGALQKDTLNSDGSRTRTWKLNEEIPTYLACVAVGNYVDYISNYIGIERNIPIQIAILPSDSINAALNVERIKLAMSIYENRFGPYRWNKVGYSLVPFNQGAMEHATNIAYPRSFINSVETYSSILVHELSHHWFGDLITCSSQEEMWLNEGWASYCEHIFTEGFSGHTAYINGIKNLHQNILQFAGYKEGNINLNSIPHEYTYGDHVYSKGALIAHNLRAYMGDSLFFKSLKLVLAQHAFQSITNEQFMNGLSAASGINLNDFSNDWIKQGGWPNFSVDSFNTTYINSKYTTKVYLKQSKFNNINYFNNVPMEISFLNGTQQKYTTQINLSGAQTIVDIDVPFQTEMLVLNMDDKIMQAVTSNQFNIKSIGNYNFTLAKMNVNVTSNTDSSLLRIEQHFVGPGGNTEANIVRISPQRYWKIDGILSNTFKANARFSYDGRTVGFSGNYYLDHLLNITDEDSILLLYRKDRKENWAEFPYYKLEPGTSKTNKSGNITIDSLWKGEYCIGIGSSINTGIRNTKQLRAAGLNIYPSPVKEEIYIELNSKKSNAAHFHLTIYNNRGQKVFEEREIDLSKKHRVDTKGFTAGLYVLSLKGDDETIRSAKFLVE